MNFAILFTYHFMMLFPAFYKPSFILCAIRFGGYKLTNTTPSTLTLVPDICNVTSYFKKLVLPRDHPDWQWLRMLGMR